MLPVKNEKSLFFVSLKKGRKKKNMSQMVINSMLIMSTTDVT
jgi:hypothetical protein